MVKTNVNGKSKKSFKEVAVRNKGKIIAGISCVAVGTVTFLICKHQIQLRNNTNTIEFVRDIVKEGALEEAIATVNRKIAYRIGKIGGCDKHNSEVALMAKQRYEEEIKELTIKLNRFKEEYDSIRIK